MPPGNDQASVCCIGGMTMDSELALEGPVNPGATNPVHGRRAPGGSARNVAVCLAQLATPTRLLSIVGDDQDGRELVLDAAQRGIDTGLIQKSLSRGTGSFVIVKNLDGTRFAVFADMRICASMDRGFIQNRWIPINQSPIVFADAWLPADSLAWLIAGCREHRVPLLIGAVSTAAARHLPLNLNGVELLACSDDEARAILGDELERDADEMAAALRQRGAARVVVAAGARMACAGREATFALEMPPGLLGEPLTRAAFHAGVIYGRLRDRAWRARLSMGLEAARLVKAGDGNAGELSPEAITADSVPSESGSP